MKKKISICILALLLCMVILCGCVKNVDPNKQYYFNINLGDPATYLSIRSDQYIIISEGYERNSYDYFTVQDITAHTVSELKEKNNKEFRLILEIHVREVDDGYQHIALYGYDDNSPLKLYKEIRFEIDPGRKVSSPNLYSIYQFEFIINMDELCDFFVVRYNASGRGGNTWITSDLKAVAFLDGEIVRRWTEEE